MVISIWIAVLILQIVSQIFLALYVRNGFYMIYNSYSTIFNVWMRLRLPSLMWSRNSGVWHRDNEWVWSDSSIYTHMCPLFSLTTSQLFKISLYKECFPYKWRDTYIVLTRKFGDLGVIRNYRIVARDLSLSRMLDTPLS